MGMMDVGLGRLGGDVPETRHLHDEERGERRGERAGESGRQPRARRVAAGLTVVVMMACGLAMAWGLPGTAELESTRRTLQDDFVSAGELCLPVSKVQAVTGSIGPGQSVESLQKLALTGNQDVWQEYMEFNINDEKKHLTKMEFQAPESLPARQVHGLTVEINFRGPRGSLQLWELQIRNNYQQRWETIWDNTNALESWVWAYSKQPVKLSIYGWEAYMNLQQTVETRLISRTGVTLDIQLDYASLCLTLHPTTTPPVPAITPPPTVPERTKSCYTFKNNEIQAVQGTIGFQQNLRSLNKKEMSGSQEVWESFIEFSPESTGADFRFSLKVSPKTIPAFMKQISANANLRGPEFQYYQWYIKVLNLRTGSFDTLLDNSDAPSWRWFVKKNALATSQASDYVSDTNQIQLQVATSSDGDSFHLDFLRICLESETDDLPTLPPTFVLETASPTTSAPTTAAPTTAAPTTAAPTTAAPTTAAPTTVAPTTVAPTMGAPPTTNPTTANPTTANPTTANPTTASPTTASPTTSKPTTAVPTDKPTTGSSPSSAPSAAPTAEEPTEVCFFAKDTIEVVNGAIGFGQTAQNMRAKESVGGAEDLFDNYVEFTATATGGNFVFTVPVDPEVLPLDVGGVRVYAHMNGLNAQLQPWSIQVYNSVSKQFRTVLSNAEMEGWTWTSLFDTVGIPNTDAYISEENEMTFRLFTETNVDVFQLDFAQFCLVSVNDDLPPPPPTVAPTPFQPTPAPEPGTCFETSEDFEPETYSGGICGLQLDKFLSDLDVRKILDTRLDQGCSVVQLDTRLSIYMDDEDFQTEADFIDFVSQEAHVRGIKVSIYYPTLEIVTVKSDNSSGSAYRDHPDWIQVGLNGDHNVFYGKQEDWINANEESAWMDPENDEFVQYYIGRLLVLAKTAVDSLWLDVPLYYDTGVPWPGGSNESAVAFREWSNERNLCPSTNGCPLPEAPASYSPDEFKGDIFRAWLVWRHHSLANFLDRLRVAVKNARPSLDLFIENYPADYMDGATVALDHSFFTPDMRQGMSTVWEIDSVSNKNAMQFASVEDFANQISMRKFANGVDKDSPTWNFVYTNEAVDMGFALAGSLAVGNIPFETKTPRMKDTANAARRTEWFNWLKRRTCEVLKPPREAEAAVLYSTGTRDFGDLTTPGCGYGMYNQVTNVPADDTDWWAFISSVSSQNCPHLGGYRGAQYGLQQLHVPYKVVTDTGLEASDLVGIKMLWLPNVLALDSNAVSIIKTWVSEGGTLLTTGTVPGTMNEYGQNSSTSSIAEVFGGVTDEPRYVVPYGKGTAIMRTDIESRDLFALHGGSAVKQNAALDKLEQIVRIHVPERLIIESGDHIFVERSVEYNSKQYLYVVNYAGMQQPATHLLQNVEFWYRPPPGKRVDTIDVSSPSVNPAVWKHNAIPYYREEGSEWVRTNAVVDQFSVFTVNLVEAPEPTPLPEQTPWANAEIQETSEIALRFVLDKMRDSTREGSYKYGVFTNLIDTEEFNPLYAFGQHTTSENQGLLLRSTACMGDEQAFRESVQFVDDIMMSPMYRLINWAMDRKKKHAFLTYDDYEKMWISANAPLDDFRAIMGLFEGADRFGVPRARELGETALNSVYWTSISDRTRASAKYPQYPGGIVGYAFDWAEVNSEELNPPGISSGRGYLYDDNIPIDYNDLDLLYLATKVNPRYIATLKSSLAMILDAEIPQSPGLFYNNLNRDGTLRGDFEFLATEAPGKHLKTIQVLWTALHLAGAEAFVSLSDAERDAAMSAARRSYNWFKDYYMQNDKIIPEYLTYDGEKVPLCPDGPDCLDQYANSVIGEARIYAQFARLGWLLGDDASFLEQVFLDKIRSDQVLDPQDPRYGMIGIEALGEGSEDSESFNILEAVMSMCRTQRNTPHQEF